MHNKPKTRYLILLLLLASLLACDTQNIKENDAAQATQAELHAQDSKKYSLPSLDPGMHQSPINIYTNRTQKEIEQDGFVVHFQDKVTAVENLGHTIQLDFKTGSTISVKDKTYTFKQMHFHTPSEHLIDGMTFPMELHIVSATENAFTPEYLVIAVLFKMGEESQFIKELLNNINTRAHSKTIVKDGSIKLSDLVSLSPTGELGHHYHYKGSLTTPPYTETVDWFVLKTIHEASPEQIKVINTIEGNNARHIEPKNERVVEDN